MVNEKIESGNNETTGPDVSTGCDAFKEDIVRKTAATWIRTERYATAGNLLGCGIHTGSSDTASLCDTGSSDTTFPVPDGH